MKVKCLKGGMNKYFYYVMLSVHISTIINGILIMEAITHQEEDLLKLDFSSSKKKKRNPKRQAEEYGTEDQENSTLSIGVCSKSKEEYTYDFLIQRAFSYLNANNPELTQRPTKTSLQPPQVSREGTRKTVVTNFASLCKGLNRDVDHVMSYILNELCVDGSIDGTNRLILRGKFAPSNIESVARKYIYDYVMCGGCKGLDTYIEKDKSTRLMFLKCNLCQSCVSIKPITTGFRAKV
jgi:translation initiation factor 2 subunit 2